MSSAGPRPRSWVSLLPRAAALGGAMLSVALLFTVLSFPTPLPLVLMGLLGLTALTAYHLESGLIVLALIVPVARVSDRPWAPAAAWPEMVAMAVIAGWLCRRVIAADRRPVDLDRPLAVTAALVIASLAVVTTLAQWKLTGLLISGSWLDTYRHGYFLMESSGDAVDTAMRLLETLALFHVASSFAERSPTGVRRLVAAITVGAAAAAAINLWAVWQLSASPSANVSAFLRELARARVNVHYADPNAAGSYFVLVLPVAVGFALERRARRWWTVAASLIALGLWVSGSRTAMMAGLVAMVLPIAARGGQRLGAGMRRRHVVVAALLVLAGLAAAAAYLLPHRGTQRSATDALLVRYELSRSAVRMLATAPVFGVGVGNFFNLSGQFASKELLTLFPPAQRENAHNYYLQLLAELGIAGFAAYVWLAWVSGRRAAWLFGDVVAAPWQWGTAVGIVAFALTCLGGHPALIDEPAFTYALLAGAAVGGGARARTERPSSATSGLAADPRRLGRVTTWLILAVLATVPLRWYVGRAAMDLSDVAFGLSGWYTGRDSVPYRLSGRTSLIYLPGTYKAITIPLRATEAQGEVDLRISVDGTVVDQPRIRTGAWQVVRVPLPGGSASAKFRRLEIVVATPAITPRMLAIGRISPY